LEIEQPIACRNFPSFHSHATLAGMLGATMVRDQVVQVCQPGKKRLSAPFRMMEALHRVQLPLDSVVGSIQQGAGDGHLRVFEDGILARLLLLNPTPHTFAVGLSCGVDDMIGKAA
jgi:hypothetical protein